MQVIMTSGPHRDPAALDIGRLASNVRLERFVSHADFLPRCGAMVTTGGAGSIMASLQAGVPLVVVPTHWDKADNAQRVVEAGVGVRVGPRACTSERVRAAVDQVLTEPRFQANARRLAERLAEAPGPPRAAELLEGLVAPDPRAAA
jgi:MGT family glycosyltransferase